MSTVLIQITVASGSTSVSLPETPVHPGDEVRWVINLGRAKIQFPGGAAPVSFSRNDATPGEPAIATVNSSLGRRTYLAYGYATGEDPDSVPAPTGETPFSAAAVLIVNRAPI